MGCMCMMQMIVFSDRVKVWRGPEKMFIVLVFHNIHIDKIFAPVQRMLCAAIDAKTKTCTRDWLFWYQYATNERIVVFKFTFELCYMKFNGYDSFHRMPR